MDAIDFHNNISNTFSRKYNTSKDFKERFEVWDMVLKKYVKVNHNILDAGCGSGILSFNIEKVSKNVIGVDGSDAMIKLCEDYAHLNNSEVQFMNLKLPLPKDFVFPHQFDIIISSSVLEYIEDINQCLLDFNRRMHVNSYLIVSMPNKRSIYRRLEKIVFSITGKPKYYKYVKNLVSVQEFNDFCLRNNFEYIEHKYFATNHFISKLFNKLLPEEMKSNLFIGVYRKF